MARWRTVAIIVGVLLAWGVAMSDEASASGSVALQAQISEHLRAALMTQGATRERMRVLGGGSRCSDARFISYRRSDHEREIVDQWYVASQLWADAALISAARAGLPVRASSRGGGAGGSGALSEWDEREARCHLDKGFVFMELLWDDGEGGYYPRSNLSGSKVSRATRFADDNAVAGLALLAAADAFPDGAWRDHYIRAAIEEAEYLVDSGLWDDTFGGGFWWNTGLGDSEEGKPAQSNALAALFFARLHAATGVERYRGLSLKILDWLDRALFDPSRNLYRWSVAYQRPAARSGRPVVSHRYFNYDQGIAIEAQIAAARLDGDGRRLGKARAIGHAIHASFWNRAGGGYNLEAGVEQVFTSYGAWTSLGHLDLYRVDDDARWLKMAQANAGALATTLRESDGGYAYRHHGAGARPAIDRTRDTAAQAWMQHLQTALARTLARG